MKYTTQAIKSRKADHQINAIFLKRWSPRAIGKDVSKDQLMQVLEAARWAPSSSNQQPWRFIYAKNGSKAWKPMFDLLVEFNQIWCKNAAYLVLIVSKNISEKDGKSENRTHSFDTGAAWMSAALQAADIGLVTHGMAGFDYDKAKKLYKIPKEYSVEAMFALASKDKLSVIPERMQKGEVPSTRKPISKFAFSATFKE